MKTTLIATAVAYLSFLPASAVFAQDRKNDQSGCDSSFAFTRSANQRVATNAATGHNLSELYDPVNGFTWETWVYLKDTNFLETSLIAVEDSVLYEDIFLAMGWNGIGSNSQLTFLLSSNVTGWTVKVNGSTRLMPLRWYHVAATCDYASNTIALYLNGVNIGSTSIPFPVTNRLSRNIPINFGNIESRDWYSFNGYIDDVKFWKGVRTPAQIAADSAGCISLPQPNLLAYFKAQEGTGTVASSSVSTAFAGDNASGWGPAAPAASCDPASIITSSSVTICDTSDSVSINVDIWNLAGGAPWTVTFSDGTVITGIANASGHGTGIYKVFPAVTTTYNLASMTPSDCGHASGTITVSVADCSETSVSGMHAQPLVRIYPNPNGGLFTIAIPAEMKSVNVTISDALGRIVKRVNITERLTSVNLENQPTGVYYVTMTGEQTTNTQRIIVK